MAEKLKIISLGGLNEIGKNLTVYEYGNDIVVVDCGMGFPDDDMYGIDVVIPDVTYLIKNQQKIRGIFITHGHEDHIGALPYVLRSIKAPIYATRMSAGLIKLKLEEHRLLDKTKLITCEAGDVVKAGRFLVEFIHVNHSIADAVAFATAWASWARREFWPCWPTQPTWSARAIPAASAVWGPPLTPCSGGVRSASSSPPSPPMWTVFSRSLMWPPDMGGKWLSPAGAWRTP